MSGLVIKEWKASETALDQAGNHVRIIGRESGLIAWALSLAGIDPTVTLLAGQRRLEFTTSSLAGTQSRLVPLEKVCSSYYGYHKPWKAALVVLLIFCSIGFSLSEDSAWPFFTLFLLGLALSIVYYFLNRRLTLGFVEDSGVILGITFKRSVIENVDINESQAKQVCLLVQNLIEGGNPSRKDA